MNKLQFKQTTTMSTIKKAILNNGVEMPKLGLGVYQINNLQECEETVLTGQLRKRLSSAFFDHRDPEIIAKRAKRRI